MLQTKSIPGPSLMSELIHPSGVQLPHPQFNRLTLVVLIAGEGIGAGLQINFREKLTQHFA